MVGLHTMDAPPPTRQPKCQAFSKGTPNKTPSKFVDDAKQIAKQSCNEKAGERSKYTPIDAASSIYPDAGSICFDRSPVDAAVPCPPHLGGHGQRATVSTTNHRWQ
jgi:hypothetical protein